MFVFVLWSRPQTNKIFLNSISRYSCLVWRTGKSTLDITMSIRSSLKDKCIIRPFIAGETSKKPNNSQWFSDWEWEMWLMVSISAEGGDEYFKRTFILSVSSSPDGISPELDTADWSKQLVFLFMKHLSPTLHFSYPPEKRHSDAVWEGTSLENLQLQFKKFFYNLDFW